MAGLLTNIYKNKLQKWATSDVDILCVDKLCGDNDRNDDTPSWITVHVHTTEALEIK